MIFNEILIPQDSFSRTTVTRRRIRRRMNFIKEIFKKKDIFLQNIFFIFKKMKHVMHNFKYK